MTQTTPRPLPTSSAPSIGLVEADAPAAARKRRKKSGATGAAEDCHTCRRRQVECDRRRPYCSQCIALGKECSGYRTVLTWGVGVASRGKLRGMALPIPGEQGKSHDPSPQKSRSKRLAEGAADVDQDQTPEQNGRAAKRARAAPARPAVKTESVQPPPAFPPLRPSAQPNHPNGVDNWHTAPPHHHPPPNGYHHYAPPGHANGMRPPAMTNVPPGGYHYPPQDPYSLHTAWGRPGSEDANSTSPSSAVSAASYASYANYSATSYPNSPYPPSMAHTPLHTPIHNVPSDSSMNHAAPMNYAPPYTHPQTAYPFPSPTHAPPATMPHLSEYPRSDRQPSVGSVSSSQAVAVTPSSTYGLPIPVARVSFSNIDFNALDAELDAEGELDVVESSPEQDSKSLVQVIPNVPPSPMSMQISPRMQYLLNYYSTAICPVLVSFDGPLNPYRSFVMNLAMDSPALQNALAALVTNNMRMRGYTENIPTDAASPIYQRLLTTHGRDGLARMTLSLGTPSSEEQHYKTMAIKYLSSQLENTKATNDGVLATLLILCLFHVCDSGFSKFQTQLAGVQKVLKLRRGSRTDFVRWVEMFFAWFDVMTAAVNDREIAVQSDFLNMYNLSENLGELEEFSGCDGRLFKLIALLSRLNVLSQRRPVREVTELNVQLRDPPVVVLDDQGVPCKTSKSEDFPDDRHEFWMEWRRVRWMLCEWKNEHTYPYVDPATATTEQHDMEQISESFRYSALLYMERLARPDLPSSSANFQTLVKQSIMHISRIGVNSCVLKFMLWPMFVTGTECVDESDRNIIRDRCIEIKNESGFYNNVSGLELLEKIWGAGGGNEGAPGACGNQAFRWRRAMDRPAQEGEYIVI